MTTWGLLAAKYPRSILGDEQPLLVLALLERKGLATEDELQLSSQLSLPTLRKILIDLHLDGLVEYGNQSLRITEKGKLFVDRFHLVADIVRDVVDSMAPHSRLRNDYEQALTAYRQHSFRFYQNSLCSMRVWKHLADAIPASKISGTEDARASTGMETLLLRDLRNWLRHEPVAATQLSEVSAEFRTMLFVTDVDEALDDYTNDPRKWEIVVQLKNFEKSTLPVSKAPRPYQFLLMNFHNVQAHSEPDLWFDAYCHAAPELLGLRELRGASAYVHRQSEILHKHFAPSAESSVKPAAEMFDARWRPARFPVSLNRDIFDILMMCSSRAELVSATGLPDAVLEALLVDIRLKCDQLSLPAREG
jgi:hypothetical protein